MFRLDWNQERPSGPIRLVVSGELCEAAHDAIVAALERARLQAATVELDLSNVTRVDRSLVHCLAHLCTEGVSVTVSRCPAYLVRWFREERTAGPEPANDDPPS
jgi:ABC-type transporter Mla MlaB component